MTEEGQHLHYESQSTAGKWILLVVAILVIAGFGYAHYTTYKQVGKLKSELATSQALTNELQNRMQTAEAEEETLARQAGMTKKELQQKTQQILAEQRAAELRLAKQQKEQISAISGDIAGVRTDVGGVKTDLGNTKADLEATKQKLQSTIGDLGVQSGLVANTRSDLELLKHRGDRNYYEFTLLKGAKPQPVATVSLQLRKSDPKHGKFTLNVTSDDKTIEKRDRNASEPIQFYSGRDHLLFELVVWTVEKKKVTGYLSTPKAAPVPVTATSSGSGN